MTNTINQTLILGGGFTGLFTALYLSHQHYPRSVILIDREDRFSFKPLLYEYCTGEMSADEVCPPYEELLKHTGVVFIQDSVESIDIQQKEIKLTSGSYKYSNLVLALGSVTSYSGVEGAKEHGLPLRTATEVQAIERQLHDRLQQARQTRDTEQRRHLLTFVIVGGGPTGVEMTCTLADLLPHWYEGLGGNSREIQVVLLNHGEQILEGDVNVNLRSTALQAMLKRAVPVELLLGAKVSAVRADAVEYTRHGKSEILPASTVIWTAGTAMNPLIKDLPVPKEHRDRHGRLQVTPTLQLLDYPEVFAAGDCAVQQGGESLPATAQVAYQQAAAIAHNLKSLVVGHQLKPAQVHLRGTLMKLGIEESVANIFDRYEIIGRNGHLIRQATYLEMLPSLPHDFKVTTEWLKDEVFDRYLNSEEGKQTVRTTVEAVGGVVIGALIAKKLLQNKGKSN